MTWYAAHAIIGMQRTDLKGRIGVYENVFLVEAKSSDEAGVLATEMARVEADLDDGLTIDNVPAIRIFAGIRKIISVSNPDPLDLDVDRPVSGTEITYSLYEVDSEDDLHQLASGEDVCVKYIK